MNRIRIARSAAACITSALSAATAHAQVDIDKLPLSPAAAESIKAALGMGVRDNHVERGAEASLSNFDFRWHYVRDLLQLDSYSDSEIDVTGNFVVSYNTGPATDGSYSATVLKLKVSDNTVTSVGQSWQPQLGSFPNPVFSNRLTRDLAVDFEGNIYVGLDERPPSGVPATAAIHLAKVKSDGAMLWTTDNFDPTIQDGGISSVALDGDGVPFAMGLNWVARFDPITGAISWLRTLPQGFQPLFTPPGQLLIVVFPKIVVDGSGDVYVAGSLNDDADGDMDCAIYKLSGATGDILWKRVWRDTGVPGDPGLEWFWGLDVNPVTQDVVVYAGVTGPPPPLPETGRVRAELHWYDRDGTLIHTDSAPSPRSSWNYKYLGSMTVSPAGYVVTAVPLELESGNQIEVKRFGPNPASESYQGYFGPGPVAGLPYLTNPSLATDRLGNIYCAANQEDRGRYLLVKLDPEFNYSGSTAFGSNVYWGYWGVDPNISFPLAQLGSSGIKIDAGANVFVPGGQAGSLNGFPYWKLFIDKISQPFVSQPTLQKAAADLQFENRSIRAPGAGNLVSQDDFFTVNWTDEGVDASDSVDVPILGTFGGSFVFKTSGSLTGGYKAEVNGGTVDVHMPIQAEFLIPSSEKFGGGGSPVTIFTDWEASGAARMTSCFTPSVNAGLTAGGNFRVRAAASATAFSASLFNAVFFDFSKVFPLDYIPNLNLLDLLALAGLPVPGEWFEFELYDGLFEGAFRTPTMMAQGRYDPDTKKFTTTANDRFFNFGLNITEAIMRAIGGRLGFDFEYPLPEQPPNRNPNDDEEELDEADFGVRGSASALQLVARVDLAIQQDLEVQVQDPSVRYVFSDGVPTQTIPLGSPLNFILPGGWDGELVITPIVATSATFKNETDIQFIPGIKWRTIEGGASLFAFGFDLLTLGPWCFLCYDWDLAEILEALGVQNAAQYVNFSLNIFPLRAPTLPGQTPGPGLFPGSWSIPFPEVTLPSIRIVQDLNTQPRLLSASRSSMSMLIYDQTSPTVASFNVTANGKTKMLLYGSRFCNQPTPSTPCDVAPQAYILHYGRQEALTTTAINASTALIEIPNRFRLLPGVAKIWVVANGKTTETIDMPIEYPTPRLDAVNPNLWAADPDLADLPIAVIDAKTFRGNDTYIARRDYYIKMRNNLWNASTALGLSATAYFPGFNWNQMPGFPSVLWGGRESGVPLPRFVQPVDNGIHNVRLADGNYDRAQVVPVTLCNPSPGGGFGNTINLTIAAPIPVVNGVTPSELAPSDIEYNEKGQPQPIELTISGPKHVPQFFGYEEPKYGNFNADSVVRFNGTPLQTTFISSSRLLAMLPPNLVTLGNHTITVHTPGNGTQYFEERWTDADGDGKRDGKPVFQGLIDSGGESVAMLFPVRYRQPDVSQLSPPTSVIDNVAFNLKTPTPKNPQGLNFTLQGQDFRPGAVVYFNNQPRLTTFVDKTIIRARLLPQDVDVIGQFPITVRNPAPDFQVSQPIIFTVKPPDPNLKTKLHQTQAANLQKRP